MAESTEELEVSAGDKKLRLRGSDLLTSVIGMIVCSGLAVLGYMLVAHKDDTRGHGDALISTLKEVAASTKDGAVAQREMNCLISLPQEQREKSIDICKRLAR